MRTYIVKIKLNALEVDKDFVNLWEKKTGKVVFVCLDY